MTESKGKIRNISIKVMLQKIIRYSQRNSRKAMSNFLQSELLREGYRYVWTGSVKKDNIYHISGDVIIFILPAH